MPPIPAIGLLVHDDDVEAVVLEGWPEGVPPPRFVVFDFAGPDVPDKCVLHVSSGAPNAGLVGHELFPVTYQTGGDHPSPNEILSLLDERKHAGDTTPLQIARALRQSILNLDGKLNRLEQAPTGDEYNHLYALANGGLIQLLKALGDPTDFGD